MTRLPEDPSGQVEWVVAVLRDVTERFKREKALRASGTGFALAIERFVLRAPA